MQASPRAKASRKWFYPSVLILSLILLGVLPRLVRNHRYLYVASGQVESAPAWTYGESFPVIWPKGQVRASLQAAASKYPAGLIVNFWATWCAPCIEELPALEALFRSLKEKNDPSLPGLVTLSVDEKASDVHRLFASLAFKPSFPVWHDVDGSFGESVGTTKFPETYWIGQDGKVKHKWLGPQNWLSDAVVRRLTSE
jgi:thiol-disulfide isomerase/thioredoxin